MRQDNSLTYGLNWQADLDLNPKFVRATGVVEL